MKTGIVDIGDLSLDSDTITERLKYENIRHFAVIQNYTCDVDV